MLPKIVLSIAFATVAVAPVAAHEFWIEPVDSQISADTPLKARLYVGQMLKGDEQPWLAALTATATITSGTETAPLSGTLGDRPALTSEPPEGLAILAFESTSSRTRYRTAAKFAGFLEKEGLDGIAAAHIERDLPEKDFNEAYTRFGKSLVAVGNGAGSDRALGLRYEIVAETNPYTDPGPVRAQLLLEGAPVPGAQIAIFRREEDKPASRETLRSDETGHFTVARSPGSFVLLSAVHMAEPSAALADRKKVVWHSLWASLTWQVKK